jgi:hypothetical protein
MFFDREDLIFSSYSVAKGLEIVEVALVAFNNGHLFVGIPPGDMLSPGIAIVALEACRQEEVFVCDDIWLFREIEDLEEEIGSYTCIG